jgi:hypothetical protein
MEHGGNATTSQGWQDTAWSPSGAKHPPPQPHSALPTPYPTVSSYGLGVVQRLFGSFDNRSLIKKSFTILEVSLRFWDRVSLRSGMSLR